MMLPYYFLDNEGEFGSLGLLNSEIQYHPSVTISKELLFDCSVEIYSHIVGMFQPNETMSASLRPDSYQLIYKGENAWCLFYIDSKCLSHELSISKIKGLPTLLENIANNLTNNYNEIKLEIKKLIIEYRATLDQSDHIGAHVGINHSSKGFFLISTSFSPCQAVAARLHTGEVAIYHAFSGFNCSAFQAFIDKIRGQAIEAFVFQKKSSRQNMKKAPFLTVELSNHLEIEVKRIHLDDYSCIIADAKNNKIILCNQILFESNDFILNKLSAMMVNPESTMATSSQELSLDQAIPMSQSITEIIAERGPGTYTNNGLKLNDFFISSQWLPPNQDSRLKNLVNEKQETISYQDANEANVLLKEKKDKKQSLTNKFRFLFRHPANSSQISPITNSSTATGTYSKKP